MRSCYNPENFKNAYPPTKEKPVPVLFNKKVIPASMGTSAPGQEFAPKQGAYTNSLVVYEADETYFIYDSFGNYTKLPVSTETNTYTKTEINELISQVVGQESTLREEADVSLSGQIDNVADTRYTKTETDTLLNAKQNVIIAGSNINISGDTLSAIDTTYTAGSGLTLTDTEFSVNTNTIQPKLTAGNNIVISGDTISSPVDAAFSDASTNAIQNSTVSSALNRDVITDIAAPSTPSTTSVELTETKTNLKTSTSTTTTVPLPVASTAQAGVMNKATYDTITNTANDVNALLNGAVSVTGLSSSPSQSDITTAWQTETGLSSLINRASVYDIDNDKVWTYYTNASTWYAASNTTQVTINTFTNSSEGTIKGSTTAGQIYAESDGTGSVNGWDTLSGQVSTNTSKLSTIAQGAEVNVQSDWNESNSASDAYIQNKPSLATVATSGSYVDLSNKPTIPTITLSTTDIGEGAALAANTLYGVYV